MKKNLFLPLVAAMALLAPACSKNDDTPVVPATLVKQWDVVLNTKFENPAPAGRTETGTAKLELFSDSSMKYTITVAGLAGGDNLTLSHIHWGDPLDNGPVILNFTPTFANGLATGTVKLRQSLADSLKTGEAYVNVHSTLFPAGLLRGQLNDPVDFAIDVAMVGTNEVPSVTTTATGLALLRLAPDKKLYSKITVTNLESNDTLSVAHIHGAAAGVNGSVLQLLCANLADFGVKKSNVLTDANVTALKTGAVYVNAHSKVRPGGIVRGQIR
jgi:CHRD domain